MKGFIDFMDGKMDHSIARATRSVQVLRPETDSVVGCPMKTGDHRAEEEASFMLSKEGI